MTAADLAIQLILGSPERGLAGKVLGLVGYGSLGRQIASRAVHCGMEVIYADPEPGAQLVELTLPVA